MDRDKIVVIMNLIEQLAYIRTTDTIELTFEIIREHNEEWSSIKDVPESYYDVLKKDIEKKIEKEFS